MLAADNSKTRVRLRPASGKTATLSPQRLLYPTEAVLGPRPRKGASAECCSVVPRSGGSLSGLGSALLFFWDSRNQTMSDDFMKVAVSEGGRRLPVYLLLDCSGSMAGAPIEAVRHGLETFAREVKADVCACQTLHLGAITFNDEATLVTKGLVSIEQFQPPNLIADGLTSLGKALRLLQQSLDTDLRPSVKGKERGDWKPLVFILTDGEPTDDWQAARQEILNRQQRKVLNVITVGCGTQLNEQNLKDIAIGPTFRMDNSEHSFKTFFQWVTQSVKAASKAVSQPGGGDKALNIPQPNPQQIQFIL